MKLNTLVVGENLYEMSKAYREGALAMRNAISFKHNPHPNSIQANYDWENGHMNEAAGEHFRFGIDVIIAPLNGRYFEEDASVPRITDTRNELDFSYWR
jgi:hypothetical protein